MSSARAILRLFGQVVKRGEANCRLHPLIHTRLEFNLAQDMAVCQRREKKAHTDPLPTKKRHSLPSPNAPKILF